MERTKNRLLPAWAGYLLGLAIALCIVFPITIAAAESGSGGRPAPQAASDTRRLITREERLRGIGHAAAAGGTIERSVLSQATRKVTYETPASVAQRIQEINVLSQAFVDPHTGEVTFIGTYDPAYASGPVPYAQLLADALQNSYPEFSLEHRPADPGVQRVEQTIDGAMAKLKSDSAYGLQWMTNLFNPLLRTQEQCPERWQMEEHLARLYQITPEEYAAFITWNGGKGGGSMDQAAFERVVAFHDKLLEGVGVKRNVGAAYLYLVRSQTDQMAVQKSWALLGLDSYINGLKSDYQAGQLSQEQLLRKATAALYREMLLGFGVPAGEVESLARNYINVGNEKFLFDKTNEKFLALFTEALKQPLNGISFSDAYMTRFYNLPTVQSGVRLYGGRSDSPLMRVMFEADYVLKYIQNDLGASRKVPGPGSWQQFYQMARIQAGTAAGRAPDKGVNRAWLYPGQVTLESYPDGSGVRFGPATVRIGAETLEQSNGVDAAGREFFRQTLAQYGEALTGKYEDYARAYPALHVMRETEKVIALARWLKAHNITPRVVAGTAATPVPDNVPGFWGLTYILEPSGSSDSMYLWMSGGVSFNQEYGEQWIKEQVSPDAAGDALYQLNLSVALADQAAGAALQGNLETARDLAEKSAQAMTGQLDFSQLPAVVPVPTGVNSDTLGARAAAAASTVETLDANVTVLNQAHQGTLPAAAGEGGELQKQAQENLNQLQTQLHDYQNGSVSSEQLAVDLSHLKPGTVPHVEPIKPPAGTASQGNSGSAATGGLTGSGSCVNWQLDNGDLTPERKAFLQKRLAETHERLQHINEALRNISELTAKDARQLEALTKEISSAYEESVDRALDVVMDLLITIPLDKSGELRELSKQQNALGITSLNKAIQSRLDSLNMLDAAGQARVYEEIAQLNKAKNNLLELESYGKQFYDWQVGLGKGAQYAYNVGKVGEDPDFYQRAKNGAMTAAQIALDCPQVEKVWNHFTFLKNTPFAHAVTIGNMAGYASGFFWDIMKQQYAWGPLAEQLQNNLEANRQAVEHLRSEAAKAYQESACLEKALKQ